MTDGNAARSRDVESRSQDVDAYSKCFRISDWPMGYFVAIEREHTSRATLLLRRHDIDHKSWRLLAVLDEHGELTIGDLAELAIIDRSSVSKMIAALEREGLVERREVSRDKRHSAISLSPAGLEKYQATAPLVLGLFREYFEGYEQKEFDQLMSVLRDLLSRVRATSAHPR